MRDRWSEVQTTGLTVYGVSFDTPEKNRAWRDKESFPFALLSDVDRAMGRSYGAERGRGGAARISYVIDEQGRVLHALDKVNSRKHLDDVLALLAG